MNADDRMVISNAKRLVGPGQAARVALVAAGMAMAPEPAQMARQKPAVAQVAALARAPVARAARAPSLFRAHLACVVRNLLCPSQGQKLQ
jgi:hypothetical protein